MWFLNDVYSEKIKNNFSNLEKVFALNGEKLSSHSLSEVIKVEIDNRVFYVKRYFCGGKGLRKHIGRSRCRAEWENLMYFNRLGIKTPEVVAYGEEKKLGAFTGRGVLITEETANTKDLDRIASSNDPLFEKYHWRLQVANQVAENVRKLHSARFIHNDLNWRNILVTLETKPEVIFLDVPMGRKHYFTFKRFAAKDIAYLDKKAKQFLSKSFRLRFYLLYKQKNKLINGDKKFIEKTFSFFCKKK